MLRSLFRTRAAKVTLAATSGVFLYDLYSTNQSRLEMVAGASTTNSKSHHAGTGFKNPWPSAASVGWSKYLKVLSELQLGKTEAAITAANKPPKVEKLKWEVINDPSKAGENTVVATWLGHACMLVQINGFNVLFDPIFSDRCSPLSFAGPKRYTEPPCSLDELPKIDAVVISHNHYDHLDSHSIQHLAKQNPHAKFYVPLGNKAWFSLDDNNRVVELDWWDSSELSLQNNEGTLLKLTCTPCQHFSGRGLFDRNKTLWASWCVEGISGGRSCGKVFFGGDTGYRAVPGDVSKEKQYDEAYLESLPHCPAFKEIGEKVGPFDLAMIPIGAYSPRWFMSTVHCSPEDAVRVHEDIRSKKSIGIHWGTFVLTDEPVDEPPQRLKAAMKNRGHDDNDFTVLKLGETFVIPYNS
ncbi:hypothetical protein VTP01DRAFT_789 [Rhizomucor pusillus]|uniref:uncharacterized protein n=1 Tax=Rhizomucor pusillus TaxID=4840 RepID=UPI0037447D44